MNLKDGRNMLHLLCGIPGSGKSTLAARMDGYVVSTDSIRKYLWNDESVIKHDELVFKLAEDIVGYMLKKGHNVIFDATNLTAQKRKRFAAIAAKNDVKVTLHWVNCPLQTALERNALRDRKVPVEIIGNLYNSFQFPTFGEGINVIKVYDSDLNIKQIVIPGFILGEKAGYTKSPTKY